MVCQANLSISQKAQEVQTQSIQQKPEYVDIIDKKSLIIAFFKQKQSRNFRTFIQFKL